MADLKPVYLVAGTDRPKIETALGRLRGRFDPAAIEVLDAVEATAADAVAACNTLGLLGGDGRLVIVENVDGRRNSEGRLVGGWKAVEAKEVAEYLKDPAAGTTLALVANEGKRDSALAKACAKAGEVLVYDAPRERDLPSWVAKQLEARGARITPEACRALVELAGDDLFELSGEIDKLATWAGGDEIAESDVRELAVGMGETSGFELTDAWGRRDVAAALAAAEAIFERSGKPRRDGAARLASILAAHVERVRDCQRLEAEGVSAKDAAGRLRRHPFYVQKLYGQARNFSADELRMVVVRLAALDRALKGDSKLAPDLELERALVETTKAAGSPSSAGLGS
jgi:DNA polymerase III subunit delta